MSKVQIGDATLYLGDCLDQMVNISSGSIDMILCDLPYGTTACKWDTVIPFAPLWEQYRRIAKRNAAIVLTASQPFTSALVMSNPKMFKYAWVWHKNTVTGFQDVNHRPLKEHEDVLVFSSAGCSTGSKPPMNYVPQGLLDCRKLRPEKQSGGYLRSNVTGGGFQTKTGWPRSVLAFKSESQTVHPTQKPVALMEYLIRTYTNEGETVMDNCMGSGTTGVAALQLGRKFIGIEREEKYFDIACKRIEQAMAQGQLFEPAPIKQVQEALYE